MINSRTLTLLGIALVLALGAVFLAQRLLTQQQAAVVAPPPVETISVVVAGAQIPALEKIQAGQVKVLQVPKSSLPFDASLPNGGLNFYNDPAEVIGKLATQTLYPNEFIVRNRLRDSKSGSTLSNLLAPSMRAVSVRVDDVTGVAGFLVPGNRVDILVNQKALDSELLTTRLLLQNVKVIAVDQTAATDDDGKPIMAHTITVELRPQDASKLARAGAEGNIQMSLRNPKDDVLLPESAFVAHDERPRPKPVTAPEQISALPPSPPPQPVAPLVKQPPKQRGSIRTLLKGGVLVPFECFKDYCQPLGEMPPPENPGLQAMDLNPPLEGMSEGLNQSGTTAPRLLPE